MKKKTILLLALLLATTSCDQSHLQQALAPAAPVLPGPELTVQALSPEILLPASAALTPASDDAVTEERKKLITAISATFERRTTPERAKWLAQLCHEKTEGTLFSPLDLAEIALAETGGHRLSSRAVSCKGALGVWQLMPERAISHGYQPEDMRDDEKCAEAAVRELAVKLRRAKGNVTRAKRLYCGAGRAARAFEATRKRFRKEILHELQQVQAKHRLFRELEQLGATDVPTRG